MQAIIKLMTATLLIFSISGCGPTPPECDDETVADIIGNNIKEQIRRALINNASPRVGGPKVSEKEINNILSEFKPKLVSTRTIKVDKSTNKSYCAGKMAFEVSKDALSRASKGMDRTNLDSTMNLLLISAWTYASNGDFDIYGAKAGIKTGEREYGEAIEYMAQLTDKGDETYVEFSKTPTITSFFMQISAAAINGSRPPRIDKPIPTRAADPEACLDAKILEFRRMEGEEAPVMHDMLTEWEQECSDGR